MNTPAVANGSLRVSTLRHAEVPCCATQSGASDDAIVSTSSTTTVAHLNALALGPLLLLALSASVAAIVLWRAWRSAECAILRLILILSGHGWTCICDSFKFESSDRAYLYDRATVLLVQQNTQTCVDKREMQTFNRDKCTAKRLTNHSVPSDCSHVADLEDRACRRERRFRPRAFDQQQQQRVLKLVAITRLLARLTRQPRRKEGCTAATTSMRDDTDHAQ